MVETIIFQIPEALYQRLAIASEAKLRSLEDLNNSQSISPV
jgi:hypothetical protein